jgi:uncharacterized membrane protein
MSKSLLLMICLLTGLLVLACGKSAETNRNTNATAANSTTPAPAGSVVTNKNTNSSLSADKIGIAECDAYLTSVDNCISSKVPEANRAPFRQALNTSRTEWKRMADNPQTRASLAAACKTALDHARTTYKAYNCTF